MPAGVESSGIVVINRCAANTHIPFWYIDEFDQRTTYGEILSLNNGKVPRSFSIPVVTESIIYFSKNLSFYPVYVEPGDTLEVFCEGDAFFFRSNGETVQANFLIELEKVSSITWPRIKHFSISSRTNFQLLLEEELKHFKLQSEFIQQAFDESRISQMLYEYLSAEVLYKHLSAVLVPFTEYSEKFLNIWPGYVNYLNENLNLITKDEFLKSPSFRAFLLKFNEYLCGDSIGRGNRFDVLFNSALTRFHGRIQSYLLFALVTDNIEKAVINFDHYVEIFNSECKDDSYLSYFNRLSEAYRVDVSQELLEAPNGEIDTWAHIVAGHKSKLIYIDLWASWCRPCIGEFPHSNALRDSFRGRPVSFLFVSIDNNREAWRRAVSKHFDQDTVNHYSISRHSKLAKVLQVPPIPRYILVDQAGDIIALDAPRPSSPETALRLEQFINMK